ncbi:MAG: molybdenum cofactor guanylyltransferase [Microbacterium sp.]|jgi:molybdopterin-guanine dinucleotide biosynthesis protein A|nr:molybdenum cofactor guanylyltransferase [Microbacterium sp.]
MNAQHPVDVGAVVLVGGRASRMGGGDKPLLDVGGTTLFARAVRALQHAGCRTIVAVGPELDASAPVRWVREEPPFGGPVAALAAALEGTDAGEWTVLLAGDLPRADEAVPQLIARIPALSDGAVFVADGHPQWLSGVYRSSALRRALAELGDGVSGASCRALLGGLDLTLLPDDDGVTADVDTPEDLARARGRVGAIASQKTEETTHD